MTLICVICYLIPRSVPHPAFTVACGHATCEEHLLYVTAWAEDGLDTIVKIAKGNKVTT